MNTPQQNPQQNQQRLDGLQKRLGRLWEQYLSAVELDMNEDVRSTLSREIEDVRALITEFQHDRVTTEPTEGDKTDDDKPITAHTTLRVLAAALAL